MCTIADDCAPKLQRVALSSHLTTPMPQSPNRSKIARFEIAERSAPQNRSRIASKSVEHQCGNSTAQRSQIAAISISRTLKSTPKSEGFLNRSFLGVKKGMKGEAKRGEVVGE